MVAPAQKKQLPIEEGLFTLPASPGELERLIASNCPHCGETVFPRKETCPHCYRGGMKEVLLGPRGRLYSYTVVWRAPEGFLGPVPYALVVVDFPEKVLAQSIMVDDCDLSSLKIGMEVKLVVEAVAEDGAGNEIVAFKFRPVEE